MIETEHLSITDRFIIVDNFYKTPDEVRNHALTMEKELESGGNYAGIMTVDHFLTAEHLEVISKLVGHRVKPSTGFTGKFRFTKEDDTYVQDIHFDPGDNNCLWAGVCYLTPIDSLVDGTIFWKHNLTGLTSIPLTIEGLTRHGFSPDTLKDFLNTDGVTHSMWTKTFSVPYQYNRLVLFRPWMFHSPGVGFGNSIDTARSVQTFFFSPD